jgi:MFS family permease
LVIGLGIGLGIGFAYVPATAAVQRWFVAWRGLASGMAAAGIGVGTALVPPAAWAAAALGGWRAAFAAADEIGREATFLGCAAAVVGLTALWAMADGHLLLIAFAIGFGAAYGGSVALLPAVTADRFGRRGVGGIIGVLFTERGIALLVAAPALALLTDWTGWYAVPLGVMALAGGCGVALLAVVPRSL